MDRTTAEITVLRVPADDGAITRALAALDDKLAAWADAMREAQRRIVEAAGRRASASPPSAEDRPAHAEASAGPSGPIDGQVETAAQRQDTLAANESISPAGPTPAPIAPDTSQAVAEPAPVSDLPAAPFGVESAATISEPTASDSPAAGAEEPTASADLADDETLLASLDPETARAVRVMRRMSLEPRSVRDLLTEYEAGRPMSPAAGPPKKRSWFSRGR